MKKIIFVGGLVERNKAGVSPVIANILLIAITIVAIGVVVAFVAGLGAPKVPTIALIDIKEAPGGGLILEHKSGDPISNAFRGSGQGKILASDWLNIELLINSVKVETEEAYLGGALVGTSTYDFTAGDSLLFKNFTFPLRKGDLITVVDRAANRVILSKYFEGESIPGISYKYVENENVHEGGAESFDNAKANDGNYENIYEISYGAPTSFNPSSYFLLGGTTWVSGPVQNLMSNDGSYMTFRSYQSGRTLYAHQETTTIGGSAYYLKKLDPADNTGVDLSVSMAAAGRQLVGKFVYPLAGVSSIPASTWTVYYRTWQSPSPSIAFDNVGSGNNGSGSNTISWPHTTGPGPNRMLIVGVSIRSRTITVSGVTYGSQSLTRLRRDRGPVGSAVTSEIWYLVAPAPGEHNITVTLSGSERAAGGSVSYTGVRQAAPAGSGTSGSSSTPSRSVNVGTANSWLVGHLAVQGTATVESGAGQTTRWDQETTGNRGHGSDKGPVGTGAQTISWVLSQSSNWAVSVAVLRPATAAVGHADVDILIRQSNGAIRRVIVTDVANSSNLSSTPTTRSGTYAWQAYTVVDQTDYLEIDYYIDVRTPSEGMSAYIRIDDSSLAITNQTRITNIQLPSRYTAEVEFTGGSNSGQWDNLAWTIDSRWTTDTVSVTLQLYNYQLGRYAQSGEDGYITYTSGAANIDQTQSQTITVNPTNFRDGAGHWKLKVAGVKTTTTQFSLGVDWVEFKPSGQSYRLNVEHRIPGVPTADNYELQVEYYTTGDSEPVSIHAYNFSTSSWDDLGNIQGGSAVNPNLFTRDLTNYILDGNVRIQYRQTNGDPTQTSVMVDFCRVKVKKN